MDFTSINEYFYKFSSTLLVILLLPISTFIFFLLSSGPAQAFPLSGHYAIIAATVILLWIINFIFFNKKIKSVRKRQGLREKLEKYFVITIVRFSIFGLCALILSVAFFFSRDNFFTIAFIFQLLLCGILWPRAAKVSGDLKLRGDEREMVYYKKDSF
jgi:hypothetical protein